MYAPEKEVHEYLRSRSVPHAERMLCYLPCNSVVKGLRVIIAPFFMAGVNWRAAVCRLMHFDLDTLYELHYQMITLGKVSGTLNCV